MLLDIKLIIFTAVAIISKKRALHWVTSQLKTINVDSDKAIDWKSEMVVDSGIYDQYIFNFIKKPKTPERFFWQVVGEQAGNY